MLNMDFTKVVAIDTKTMEWVASPAPGVWRKPLAREEAERGHATSIVRYEPGASFKSHNHPLGEEILVLEGTFSDETGDFHAGTYFRNPKGFVHSPFSKEGCIILVKLHQMAPDDTTRVAIEMDKAAWTQENNGVKKLALHSFSHEQVSLIKVPAGIRIPVGHQHQGEEIYVISGNYRDEFGSFDAGTWCRLPPGTIHNHVCSEDSLLWVKTGHL